MNSFILYQHFRIYRKILINLGSCSSIILSAIALAISVAFSIRSTSGCDFIRLHFEALNDNGIYFNKDESYIGLGFFYHQPLDNRNSIDWINDHTCYEYDEVSTGMFLQEGNNFQSMKTFLRSSRIVNIAVIMVILVMGIVSIGVRVRNKNANATCTKVAKNRNDIKKIPMGEVEGGVLSPAQQTCTLPGVSSQRLLSVLGHGIVLGMIGTALHLHTLALSKLDEEGGICDRNTYFPDGWYDKYPLQYYRDYAYFKFFHDCEMGEDAIHSIRAKNWQIVAFGMMIVSLCLNVLAYALSCCTNMNTGEDVGDDLSLDVDDATVGSTGTAGYAVMKQFPLEVENPSNTTKSSSSSIMVGVMTQSVDDVAYTKV